MGIFKCRFVVGFVLILTQKNLKDHKLVMHIDSETSYYYFTSIIFSSNKLSSKKQINFVPLRSIYAFFNFLRLKLIFQIHRGNILLAISDLDGTMTIIKAIEGIV